MASAMPTVDGTAGQMNASSESFTSFFERGFTMAEKARASSERRALTPRRLRPRSAHRVGRPS